MKLCTSNNFFLPLVSLFDVTRALTEMGTFACRQNILQKCNRF